MKKIKILLVLGFVLFYIIPVFAHKVNIFYYAEDNNIYLETYFSDGTKCRNSEIEFYDNNLNKLLLKGKTDLQGKFSFKIPQIPDKDTLKVVLIAEMGHRTEVTIKPSEWKESDEDSTEQRESIGEKKPVNSEKQPHLNSYNNTSELNYKKLEKILDKKLKPVLRELALLRNNKPSFNEIFGGIGYIFGLFGIIFYFKAKK